MGALFFPRRDNSDLKMIYGLSRHENRFEDGIERFPARFMGMLTSDFKEKGIGSAIWEQVHAQNRNAEMTTFAQSEQEYAFGNCPNQGLRASLALFNLWNS